MEKLINTPLNPPPLILVFDQGALNVEASLFGGGGVQVNLIYLKYQNNKHLKEDWKTIKLFSEPNF